MVGGVLLLPACYHEPAPFRIFTREEAACLVAVCERIIPGDNAPGATEAGVIYYIDKQLAGFFKNHRERYHAGLAALQSDCRNIFRKNFEDLGCEQQDRMLTFLEENSEKLQSWGDLNPSSFFNLVIDHTMQGFYGSPRHGGNKNYASYRMLGIGYPQVIGENRYGKDGKS